MAKNDKATGEVVQEYLENGGNVSETARVLGISRGTVYHHLKKADLRKPVTSGKKTGEIKETKAPLPSKGVSRYIVTCAQNNTPVHAQLWENVLALSDHYKADIRVSRIAYNINAYTAQPEKPGHEKRNGATTAELWYDPAIQEHLSDERIELAPGLVFCGELNILPTAKRPLSDMQTYTGRKSAIIPHTKLAMESVASGKHEATKFNYTTGTVTQMSYIQRKAGQQSERHHAYGALLVEVDGEGRWFVRQLQADKAGTIYDWDVKVEKGKVTTGNRVEAINWGDIHEDEMDEVVRDLAWAEGGMMDQLQPKYQFMHDSLSFNRRNHHDRGDCHKMFEKFITGKESVEAEIRGLVQFLNEESYREYCKTIIVNSNHDNALERWLKEADFKRDPVNSIYYLRLQLRKYEAIAEQDAGFHIVEYAAQAAGCFREIQWLREDESFVRVGINFGQHGDLGPDGARGTPMSLSRQGRPQNTGHTHKCGIIDDTWTAGTSSQLDLGYNRGPSSWSHSHIITYPGGSRAICTMWDGRCRA